MGFSSEWLEQSYLNWRHTASARLIRIVLFVTSGSAFLRTLGHIPGFYALWTAAILLLSTVTIIFNVLRPLRITAFQILAGIVLLLDVIFSLPGYESLFPAVLAVFSLYAFFSLPFYVILATSTLISIVQTCSFLLFVEPLHTNEVSIFDYHFLSFHTIIMFPNRCNFPLVILSQTSALLFFYRFAYFCLVFMCLIEYNCHIRMHFPTTHFISFLSSI
ncbi:hypothetical protein L3Y34_001612 [Caenorhabditis briggsae]|uniref:Uncharacterized protein n=1 Tax=Caenorhabditis briggsae TaxID=6238 RepID=A0AAE9DDF1_CAEBR|nr:hypothetical protein L3Y34_001612 [Caenorhabditis briggsae]